MNKSQENKNSFSTILRGDFIANKNNQKHVPFLIFIVLLVLLNIRISFRAERLLKESIRLEKEVAELRLSYITTKSALMNMHKRSVIEDIVYDKGLKTSLVPPTILNLE